MAQISIIGSGNRGQTIAGLAGEGGNTVELLSSSDTDRQVAGDIVALSVPYPAVGQVGFLQLALAAGEKTSWTGGFTLGD